MIHFAYPNVKRSVFIGCGRFIANSCSPGDDYKLIEKLNISNIAEIMETAAILAPESSSSNFFIYLKKDKPIEVYAGDSQNLAYLLAIINCSRSLKIDNNINKDIWCTGSVEKTLCLKQVDMSGFEIKLKAFLSPKNNDKLFIVPAANIQEYRHLCSKENVQIKLLKEIAETESIQDYFFQKTILAVHASELELLVDWLFVPNELSVPNVSNKPKKNKLFWTLSFILLLLFFCFIGQFYIGEHKENIKPDTVVQPETLTHPIKQTRIVVLPFYEESNELPKEDMKRHYRRISGFINNNLVSEAFEVINPFAVEWKENEYDLLIKRSRKESAFVCKEMCRKYSSDIAYIVWLDLKKTYTPDNFCKVNIVLEGQGYDSASRDVGVYMSETIQGIHINCDAAVIDAEKKLAIFMGKKLIAELNKNIQFTEETIEIRIEGKVTPVIAEIIDKILNITKGVDEVQRYRFKIDSVCIWRIKINETSISGIQENMINIIKQIIDSKGNFNKNDVQFNYSELEVNELKKFKCKDSSSRAILFLLE